LIKTAKLPAGALILDGWNGSGTTTSVANALGYNSCGFDRNPVMVVVAKARLLSKREHSSVGPLAAEIIQKASLDTGEPILDDPLLSWMGPKSANDIRKLERSIQVLLVDHDDYQLPSTRKDFNLLSGIGAFLYLALFRTVRTLLDRFVGSNPTWIKTPRESEVRLKPHTETIFRVFREQVLAMVVPGQIELFETTESSQTTISIGNSELLPLRERSVHFALGSPPYCTRIDYAVATKPELAVLGYSAAKFRELRHHLLGTSTVPRITPAESPDWGSTCLTFLNLLKNHKSKASKSYYYKNHVQYFKGIFNSLRELHRVLNKEGTGVIVVQDSFYKDLKNDLPAIVAEMALANGLKLTRRRDFNHSRTMANLNPAVRQYRKKLSATESVLVFHPTQ
jgi:hypothetical protein